MKYLWEEGDKLIAQAGQSCTFVVMEVLAQDGIMGKAAVAVDVMDFTPLLVGGAQSDTNGQIMYPSFFVELPATWMRVDVEDIRFSETEHFILDGDYDLHNTVTGYGKQLWTLCSRLPAGAKFWSADGQVHVVEKSEE